MFKLKLREGLARDLVGEWLQPRRAFRLAKAGEIGINPDQRLHEDARHLAETTSDLGINLLQSTVILVSFVGVLWSLSSGFVFHLWGYSFSIPGYMVWAAVFMRVRRRCCHGLSAAALLITMPTVTRGRLTSASH